MAWFDAADLYYGDAHPVVSQGDIVLTASGVLVADDGDAALAAPARFAEERTIALWTAIGASLPEAPTLALTATWGLAMVLPHACALEKEFNERVAALQQTGLSQGDAEDIANEDPTLDRYVAVAPICLYDALADERRAGVRAGQRLDAFPVVANPSLGIPEAWVDLRRISTVERPLIETPYRLAGLSELAVAHLQFALARYWAFRDLSRADEISRAVGRRIQEILALDAPKGRLRIGIILDSGDQLTLEGSATPAPPMSAPRRHGPARL